MKFKLYFYQKKNLILKEIKTSMIFQWINLKNKVKISSVEIISVFK